MLRRTIGLLCSTLFLSTLLIGCSNDSGNKKVEPEKKDDTEVSVILDSLNINPGVGRINQGTTLSLTLAGTNNLGAAFALTENVEWHTNGDAIAITSQSNTAVSITGLTPGTAQLWATFDEVASNIVTISVLAKDPIIIPIDDLDVQTLSIYPSTLRTNTAEPQQAVAVGQTSTNALVPLTKKVTWSVANNNAATITASGMLSIIDSQVENEVIASYGDLSARIALTAQTTPIKEEVTIPTGRWVFLKKPADYDNANIYVWTDSADQAPTGDWPGTPMLAAPEYGNDWVKFDLTDTKYSSTSGNVDFKFNSFDSANDNGPQSASNLSISATTWFTTDVTGSTTAPDGMTTAPAGDHVVYFAKPTNFNEVYLYAWSGETPLLGAWP